MLAVSFHSGILWWKSSINHIEDQIGFLFGATMYWSLYPMFTAILTFPQERMMLIKEQSSRMYSLYPMFTAILTFPQQRMMLIKEQSSRMYRQLSSYFIARNVADLPMELALPSIYVTITYWMIGLKPTVRSFLVTLVVMLYNVLVLVLRLVL
ncbi:hypothetical protein MKW92_000434 [Papaver armeniacum]|nr:hypothetical protein MKW92_000434 [Papaver armeniacum]